MIAKPPTTPPAIAPAWFEELDVVDGDAMIVLVGEERRAGEIMDEDDEDEELEVDFDTALVEDAAFEVLDGFTSVVTPSITKTPFLSLQHFSARVPLPQQ